MSLLLQSQTKNQNFQEFHARADEESAPKLRRAHKQASFDDDKRDSDANTTVKYSPAASVFMRTGYKVTSKIASTLQGSVYNATNLEGHTCVLKRASLRLHNMGVACIKNKLYKVKENIVTEANIMKYLTKMNPPKGLTRIIDFFCDDKNYFLLMEHGGQSFFNHVIGFHKKLKNGEIKLKVWQQHVKILFKQMCVFLNWLHNTAKLVHLDISLENMLIKGCKFKDGKFISHGQIHFIDFGLAKSYKDEVSFENCTKYVGKQRYKAPRVYSKKPFNAAKADIWSLGVVLFMIAFGSQAYNEPTSKDGMFVVIYRGKINKWVQHFKKKNYACKSLLDLFGHMLCNENKRWTINKILKSSYVSRF